MDLSLIMVLYILGLGMIIGEVFIPGGIIGAIGGIVVLVAVWGAFAADMPLLGIALIVTALVIGPLAIIKGIRRFSLRDRQTTEDGFSASRDGIEALLGKRGVALSALRPTGFARIDKKRLSVVTQGEMLDQDVAVEVIAVEGNRVVVQKIRTL